MSEKMSEKMSDKKILFLCTGNTCRSPMAECLWNHLSAERGVPMKAISAGVHAHQGYPASQGSWEAMDARGLSLSEHRATPLTEKLLQEVHMVVGMSPAHVQALRERFPSNTVPARSFSPSVADPVGGSLAVYQRTAAELEERIQELMAEIFPKSFPQ